MSIQIKKKSIPSVNNAIDSSYINIFVDSADGVLKTKDDMGNVTGLVAGVDSVGGNSGTVTSAQIKTIYESNSDTNALTDAEKTAIDTIYNIPRKTLSADRTHPGPDYLVYDTITDLKFTAVAGKNYIVKYHIIASQPLTSASFDFTFLMDPVETDCYINGHLLRANVSSQTADFYPTFNVQNTAGANRLNYYEIQAVVEGGASDSDLIFKFKIEADNVAYIPTIHKGTYLTYEEV